VIIAGAVVLSEIATAEYFNQLIKDVPDGARVINLIQLFVFLIPTGISIYLAIQEKEE
jgi:hypothetical protein